MWGRSYNKKGKEAKGKGKASGSGQAAEPDVPQGPQQSPPRPDTQQRRRVPAPAAPAPNQDVGWLYCEPLEPGNKYMTRCLFCEREFRGGGITRFKHHLLGDDKNVQACPDVTDDVKELIAESMMSRREKEATKQRAKDALFGRFHGGYTGGHGGHIHSVRGGKSFPHDKKQRGLKGLWGNARELVGQAVTNFIAAHALPANVAEGPWLQNLIDVSANAGPGTKAPTSYEVMSKYMPVEKQQVEAYIDKLAELWPTYGVTIMADGWTSYTRRQIINFLVYCDGKTIFLRSVDASDHTKDYKYIYSLLKEVIAKVGKENVVQIVTDNGSNFKKAGKKIMESSNYGIFWTPCAAHCVDLILKDFGKIPKVKEVVNHGRCITSFIYNHGHVLSLMREHCNAELVRPGLTRFATNYIGLKSILDSKVGLKQMLSSPKWERLSERATPQGRALEALLSGPNFWEECGKVTRIMEPVVKVLRLVDGDKRPTMGYIYHALEMMEEEVKEAAGKHYRSFLKVISERRESMLSHPLHLAAYYLNPWYHYKHGLGTSDNLIAAVRKVVAKLSPTSGEQISCMNELKMFREADASFGTSMARNAIKETHPAEWWTLYGTDAPNLRKIAVRVLSQTASAGGCERNWSTFNLIHSKRRNKLGTQKLNDLVYIHYNTRLQMRHVSDAYGNREPYDPIDIAYLFGRRDNMLQSWVDDIGGEPAMDVGGRPDPEVAKKMGADLQDHLRKSGRKTFPIVSLDEDDLEEADWTAESSSNKSTSKDGGNDGGDEDSGDEAATTAVGGATEQWQGGDGGWGEWGGRQYQERHTNIHGDYIPSPPHQPTGATPPHGTQQHGGGWLDPIDVDDLSSSVGSMSIDGYGSSTGTGVHNTPGHGYTPPYPQYPPSAAGGYSSYSGGSGSDFEFFGGGSFFPQQPQPQPSLLPSYPGLGPLYTYYEESSSPRSSLGRSTSSRRSGSRTSSMARGSSGHRASASGRLQAERYEDNRHPRIGLMAQVSDQQYRQHIMDYQTMYSFMTWENYCEYIRNASEQISQSQSGSQSQAAHSPWYEGGDSEAGGGGYGQYQQSQRTGWFW